MSKWRSRATGYTYRAFDSFSNLRHEISLFLDDDDFQKSGPRARLTYAELVEAFEKVEE